MSLIRGLKGLFPCPICLVPQDSQADASKTYQLRTQQQSEDIFHLAEAERRVEDREKILKQYSLRYVKV